MSRIPCRSALAILGVGAAFLCAPSALLGQEDPSFVRGLEAPTVYDVGTIDTVNIYNGALSLTIPLGLAYPVGPNLSYQFVLNYNSNFWRTMLVGTDPGGAGGCSDGTDLFQQDVDLRSNSGIGFNLSFGQLAGPDIASGPWPCGGSCNAFRLIEPDGTVRLFQSSLGSNLWISNDSSYHRLDTSSAPNSYTVESPNGIIRDFDDLGRLTETRDRFGNWMRIQYQSSHWRVTDSHNREHFVNFSQPECPPSGPCNRIRIDSLNLEAFAGAVATYTFSHEERLITKPQQTPDADCAQCGGDRTEPQQVLTQIDLPANAGFFKFGYLGNETTSEGGLLGGEVTSVNLPTGGGYQWTYTPYDLPESFGCPLDGDLHRPRGVRSKFMIDAANNKVFLEEDGTEISPDPPMIGDWQEGSWSYGQICPRSDGGDPIGEFRLCTKSPEGDETIHFFYNDDPDTNRGLPFSPEWKDGNRGINREVYEGDAHSGGVLLRRHFVHYIDASDKVIDSESTLFMDDDTCGTASNEVCKTIVDRAGYSLGRFETETTTSNFPDSPGRTVSTSYVNVGDLATATWLLNLTTQVSVTEGPATHHRLQCFDETTGFLKAARRLEDTSASPSNSGNDLVSVFTPNAAGFPIAEQHYGGDVETAGQSWNCTANDFGATGGSRGITHTYQHGVRSQTSFTGGVTTLDLTIDDSSGLASASRDVGGKQTTYTYDEIGRLKSANPPGTNNFTTTINYTTKSAGHSENEATTTRGETGSPNTSKSERIFDDWGRLSWEVVRRPELPEGASNYNTRDAHRRLRYNNSGWQTSVSDWRWAANDNDDGHSETSYSNFDPFGRPRTIKAPDNKLTTITYAGTRSTSTSVPIVTDVDFSSSTQPCTTPPSAFPCPHSLFDPPTETNTTTTEKYDAYGRLVSVTNPVADAAYTYDPAGNLITAKVSGSQIRTFEYDGRGFLVSEAHPELGTLATDVISYTYDSLGVIKRRVDKRFKLHYTHDSSSRLTDLLAEKYIGPDESAPQFLVKHYRYYGAGAGSDRRHRLKRAIRANYSADMDPMTPPAEFTAVAEEYDYDDAGRVNWKSTYIDYDATASEATASDTSSTTLTPDNQFLMDLTYDGHGNVAALDYPCKASNHFPGTGTPACSGAERTVTNSYFAGALTDVDTTWAGAPLSVLDSIRYHPSGLLAEHTYVDPDGIQDTVYHMVPGRYYDDLTGLGAASVKDGRRTSRPVYIYLNDGVATGEYHRYDAAGNVTQKGDEGYAYNGASQIAKARYHEIEVNSTPGNYEYRYDYDAFGNRISFSDLVLVNTGPDIPIQVSSSTNRLTSADAIYDDVGNLEQRNGVFYDWDPLNLMTRLSLGSPATQISEHLYTAADERVEAVITRPGNRISTTWTLRGFDNSPLRSFFEQEPLGPQQEAECLTPSTTPDWCDDWELGPPLPGRWDRLEGSLFGALPIGQELQREWVYANGRVVASLWEDFWPSPRSLHLNLRGDVARAHEIIGGAPIGFYRISPFGRQIKPHPIHDQEDQIKSPLLFTGHERDRNDPLDVNDDLDYMHARYHSPYDGRFLSLDPINSADVIAPGSWNKYGYALNNPIGYVDPDGRAAAAVTFGTVVPPLPAPPPFLAAAAPAAAAVGGGFLGFKAGQWLGGFEVAEGLTVDSLITDFLATQVFGAPDGFPMEAGGLVAPLLASIAGEFDSQIAHHAADRGHFPGKSASDVMAIIESVRQGGEVLKAVNGNQITVKGDIVLIDDLLSDTSAGTIFRPDNIKKTVERFLEENDGLLRIGGE